MGTVRSGVWLVSTSARNWNRYRRTLLMAVLEVDRQPSYLFHRQILLVYGI